MQDEDAELGLGGVGTNALARSLDILLELLDGVLESGTGVIDLVDDQDALADKVVHLAEGAEVEPLGAGDLGANLLNLGIATELLVEGETNSLDGDVGRAGLLEEGSQDTGGDVATTADSDDQLGLELEELDGGLLAQVVHLKVEVVSACGRRGASCVDSSGRGLLFTSASC